MGDTTSAVRDPKIIVATKKLLKNISESFAPAPSTAAPTPLTLATANFYSVWFTGSIGIARATVVLQRSTNNVAFIALSTTTADASGNFKIRGDETQPGTKYYRVRYAGDATHPAVVSNVITRIVG